MRFKTRTTMEFSGPGVLGIGLLIGGPLAAAALVLWTERWDYPLILSSVATIVGFALVLVGRVQLHETVDNTEADFEEFTEPSPRQIRARRRTARFVQIVAVLAVITLLLVAFN